MSRIRTKRIYDASSRPDGFRVLVDRIWPRGMSRDRAAVDVWLKTVAPSTDLRKWFDHDPGKWNEFKRRYFAELDAGPEGLGELVERAKKGVVTLVYSARDSRHNQAAALKEYLDGR